MRRSHVVAIAAIPLGALTAYIYAYVSAYITCVLTGRDILDYLVSQYYAMGFILFYTLYVAMDIYYIVYASRRQELPRRRDVGITVVIPAYNEEATIADTIRSIKETGYRPLEIIVVDDGSTDSTAEVAEKAGARVIRHGENRGRAAAVFTGIRNARYEIVVTIDADTVVEKDSLERIAGFFGDERVGAVCGRLAVANRGTNMLTRGQSLEYSIGFAYTKRLQDAMDWVLIPSGAFSAYRRSVVVDADLEGTVAEDFDLAMHIRRKGYTIRYCEECLARTRVPETRSGFIRQRIRWGVGGLQVMAKHSDLFMKPSRGLYSVFGLPFHYLIGYAVAPLEFFGITLVLAMTLLSPLTGIGSMANYAAILLWLLILKALGITLLVPGLLYARRNLGEKAGLATLLYYWFIYYYLLQAAQYMSILIYLQYKKIPWLTK